MKAFKSVDQIEMINEFERLTNLLKKHDFAPEDGWEHKDIVGYEGCEPMIFSKKPIKCGKKD